MLGADIPGAHSVRFAHRQLDDALGAGRQALTGGHAGRALAHTALQHVAHHLIGDAVLAEDAVGDALLLADQTQQQMLGANVAVTQLLRRFLTQPQGRAEVPERQGLLKAAPHYITNRREVFLYV